MLNSTECQALYQKNAGRICWLDYLADNDARIVLKNDTETLHVWMGSECDKEEQAQAARLCGAINLQRAHFQSKGAA